MIGAATARQDQDPGLPLSGKWEKAKKDVAMEAMIRAVLAAPGSY